MATFSTQNFTSAQVFVDISDKPVAAEVIRNGAKVATVSIRDDLIGEFVAPERLDARLVQQRVVFQSIATGQRVPRGTVVNIVLASSFILGTDFVTGSHIGLADRSIGDVGDLFLVNPAVESAVRRATTIEELSPDIRGVIETTAAQNDIAITPADQASDFQALFTTIKAAQTFR
jgi:hypothetical protein